MHAAVVSSFDTAPRHAEFPDPRPAAEGEVLVEVLASGLHPRVRSQADGSHYTSTGELPVVPGIDGSADLRRAAALLRPPGHHGGRDGRAHRGRPAAQRRPVDVVLDYVWGPATAAAILAVVTNHHDRGRPLTWVEIGSVAGPSAAVPSAALRAARLQIVGSGQGSVDTGDILAELPELAARITGGALPVEARAVALPDVERDPGVERHAGSRR